MGLQSKSRVIISTLKLDGDDCEQGADVKCPDKAGTMCAGDQCCPRDKASGGLTYPCPSASDKFAGCENNTKVKSCLKKKEEKKDKDKSMLVQSEGDDCEEGADVKCPDKAGTMCAGDQCCPRDKASGGLTYPCPSASDKFAGCENS